MHAIELYLNALLLIDGLGALGFVAFSTICM